MIRVRSCRHYGFTLIEVIGALVIFSIGVLMVLRMTSALSRRMEYAAVASMINVQGQHRMDSLTVQLYTALPVGTTTNTISVRGISYTRRLIISQKSPLVRVVYLSFFPASGSWPSFNDSTLVVDAW